MSEKNTTPVDESMEFVFSKEIGENNSINHTDSYEYAQSVLDVYAKNFDIKNGQPISIEGNFKTLTFMLADKIEVFKNKYGYTDLSNYDTNIPL